MIYSTITYPYTLYQGVRQLPPASVHRLCKGKVHSDSYWEPREASPPGTFDECAEMLRARLVDNVRRICTGQPVVGLLLSAGEDSRVVATVARRYARVEARTFVDAYNREARLAERVATRLGITWRMLKREPTHYFDHLRSAVSLGEAHRLFVHAHSVGLLEDWPQEIRMLGGHLADSFAKGIYIPRSGQWHMPLKAEHLSPETVWATRWTGQPIEQRLLGRFIRTKEADLSGHREEVLARRARHTESIRELRPTTWHEWCRLWPASQLTSLGAFATSRRLFPIYEPFIDSSMVKLLSSCPQHWKSRRRLFHSAMKSLLADSRWIPHSSGIYPYWGYAANLPLLAGKFVRRGTRAAYRLAGRKRPNDGPWPYPSDMCTSEAFLIQLTQLEHVQRSSALANHSVHLSEVARRGTPLERLAALQLLFWDEWLTNVNLRVDASPHTDA